MESRNPVFRRNEAFSNKGGYASFDARGGSGAQPQQGYPQQGYPQQDSPYAPPMTPQDMETIYSSPPATPVQMGRMTIDDVVMRTAMIFGVLLLTAVPTFFLLQPQTLGLVLVSGLAAFGVAMAISFGKKVRPALILVYAALEGVFVGGISFMYSQVWSGIVPQAVLGTLGAFTGMLLLYRSGKFRVTPKFQRVMLMALVGYVIFGFVNLALSLFSGWNVYTSPLGWLVAGFGVVFASVFLMLDFNAIEQGIRNGAPQQYAWLAAWGLVVTLVWLYLEILRLLAILRGNN